MTNVISSGSPSLDLALGGGFPQGELSEVFGPVGSGKSTLALLAIAAIQRNGGVAAYIDCAHAFDVEYTRTLGVDPGKLLISQPDSSEAALGICEILTRSGALSLIVVDSIPSPTAMNSLETKCRATQKLREITANTFENSTTVLFIDSKLDTCFVEFYSAVWIQFLRPPNGTTLKMKVVKNRHAPRPETELTHTL